MTTNNVTHTLTITESTSTPPASNKLSFNIQSLLSKNGLPMLLETIIGIICLWLLFGTQGYNERADPAVQVFVLVVFFSILPTFLLLASYLMSPMAIETVPKTAYEFLHNLVAFLFYAPTSLACLIMIADKPDDADEEDFPICETGLAFSILGLGNAALYFLSTFISYKSFKSS